MAVSAWKKVPGSGARYSLRVNPSSGNLHPTETYVALARICGNRGRPVSLPRGPPRPRASQPRRLDAASCTRSRDSLGGGVAADRRTHLDFLARSLEVRRPRLSLLLPRFGPRDDELAAGGARIGTARRRGGSLQRRSPGPRAGSGRKRRSSDGVSCSFRAQNTSSGLPVRARWKRSREFRTNCPRKKFAMSCFSGCTPRRSCPILRDRCRAFPPRIQGVAGSSCDFARPAARCSAGSNRAPAALGA